MWAMTILPSKMLPIYGSLNNADFALAHVAVQDRDYADYYEARAARGVFVTLDNGAYELGRSVDLSEWFVATMKIKPAEVWIPDVFEDGQATIELMEETVAKLNPDFQPRLAGVPQGKTWEEWLRCYARMVRSGMVSTIGVPKHLRNKHPEGRLGALEELKQRKLVLPSLQYHCLGVNDMWEVSRISLRAPWVRSIDSAAPVHLAMNHMNFFSNEVPPRPANFFDLPATCLNGTGPTLELYIKRFKAECERGTFVW